MSSNGVKFRSYTADDHDFIFSSWLRSFKNSKWAGSLPDNLYWPSYQAAIEQILAIPSVQVLVACNASDPDQIFGYMVFDIALGTPILHYVYIKAPFRKLGVAKSLLSYLPDGEIFYTFRSPGVNYLSKHRRLVYKPKYVRKKPEEAQNHPPKAPA